MHYIVVESFKGTAQSYYGPFPTQDQAMSYVDSIRKAKANHPYRYNFDWVVSQLLKPAFMPEVIHG